MKLWQLLAIIDSSHFTLCTECAREIDFRRDKDTYTKSERGQGFYRHTVCPPRVIFYT